jgi:hypothetical protein
MNWEAISAVGEIGGALAVIVTLGYLAAQIRQNTHSVVTSVYESALAGFNDILKDVAANGELASIVRRGGLDPGVLSADEAFRFNFHVRTYANQLYKLLRLTEQGAFPPGEWIEMAREAGQVFSMPGFARFRRDNRFYADLWAEIEKYGAPEVSQFEFGNLPGPDEPGGGSA